jgi:hypothetical protein
MRRTPDIRLKASMLEGNEKTISELHNWTWERDDWEQFELTIHERRYEEGKRLHTTMLSQQSDLKQQLVLPIEEKRWLDAAHFCDVISRSGEEQSDVISQSVEEQMPVTNLPPSHINMEPGCHTASGSDLESSDDTISAAPRMMEATATLPEAKQDNVGNEVHDNMGKGETFGHDYDMGDGRSNETDKLKAPFADEDAMGGWTTSDQLPVWGHGVGGDDTWDPGPPPPFSSSRASLTLLHVISFQNALW